MPSYCMTADKEEEKISRNKKRRDHLKKGGGDKREGERKRDSKRKRMRTTKKRGKEGNSQQHKLKIHVESNLTQSQPSL